MSKFFKRIWLVTVFWALPLAASAQNSALNRLRLVGDDSGYDSQNVNETTFASIAGQAIRVFLSLLGVIFVILIVYAGYNWMTATGDSGKVEKAKETLWRAVIGLIITVGSYALWNWIYYALIFPV